MVDVERVIHVVEKQLRLLGLEQESEQREQQLFLNSLSRQQLQQRGVALYNLRVEEQRTGLAGKIIIQLHNPNVSTLPAHVMRVGDIVQIDKPNKSKLLASTSGIISKVSEGNISVAFKDAEAIPNDNEDGLRLLKLTNEVAYERMRYAMKRLGEMAIKSSSSCSLLNVIFGTTVQEEFTLYSQPSLPLPKHFWHNERLDSSQQLAVVKCLNSKELSLVHGPPGTGKTETLLEIIHQLACPKIFVREPRKRVLVCGPSNLSVDNIVERLAGKKLTEIVRIGHPARVLDNVLPYTLDWKLANSDSAALVKDIRVEIDTSLKLLKKSPFKRREIYAELGQLRKELRSREKAAVEDMLNGTAIVLGTLNMAGSSLLKNRKFDVVIIDEAGQALEAECWLAMLLGEKVILAGDHCQLPPTITNPLAEEGGLGVTLFERLVKKCPKLVSMLNVQYRMNEIIMKWSSDEFYHGKLSASQSVAKHLLCQLEGVKDTDDTLATMIFIDTAGFDYWESQSDDEDQSKYNEGEAKLVIDHLKELLNSGVSPKEISIITPYNAQVGLIESFLQSSSQAIGDSKGMMVQVGSVDSFQGREKEAVIISFVRSNDKGEFGFLKEIRRTNVAITRARRHVCLIGNSETLEHYPFYRRLVNNLMEACD